MVCYKSHYNVTNFIRILIKKTNQISRGHIHPQVQLVYGLFKAFSEWDGRLVH